MQLTLELVQKRHGPEQIEIDDHRFVVQSAWPNKSGWQANVGLFNGRDCIAYQKLSLCAGRLEFEDGSKRGKPEFIKQFLQHEHQLTRHIEFCLTLPSAGQG